MANVVSLAAQAAQAYRQAGGVSSPPGTEVAGTSAAANGPSFADALGQTLRSTYDQAQTAERMAESGIAGQGDLTQIVTAISRAELALQTTAAIRDRVLSAYQDIIRMPI